MKTVLVCKNCGVENSFYKFNCSKCNAILRERIVNVDLWHTLNIIIDSPTTAFSKIIQAEHKNFIFFLAFILALKVFLNTIIVSEQIFGDSSFTFVLFLVSLIAVFLYISAAAYLLNAAMKLFRIGTRFKDDYAIITYSLLPYVYALVFLFPVEITLFGGYLFSNNPSPFDLKLVPTYLLIGLELLMTAWSILLTFFAAKTVSGNNIFSLLYAIIFGIIFFLLPFLIAFVFQG